MPHTFEDPHFKATEIGVVDTDDPSGFRLVKDFDGFHYHWAIQKNLSHFPNKAPEVDPFSGDIRRPGPTEAGGWYEAPSLVFMEKHKAARKYRELTGRKMVP